MRLRSGPSRGGFKVALFATVFAWGMVFGGTVETDGLVTFLEGIKSSSSIIFGVVAAWIALVYPEELKAKIEDTSGAQKNSARLFKAFYVSSASLLIVTALPLVVLVCKSVGCPISPRACFSFSLLAACLQIWALKLVVFATEHLRFVAAFHKKRVAAAKRLIGR